MVASAVRGTFAAAAITGILVACSGGTHADYVVTPAPAVGTDVLDASTDSAADAPTCRSCGRYFQDVGNQMSLMPKGPPICPGSSATLLATMQGCLCDFCKTVCPPIVCKAGTGSQTDAAACKACLATQPFSNCADQATACTNDA